MWINHHCVGVKILQGSRPILRLERGKCIFYQSMQSYSHTLLVCGWPLQEHATTKPRLWMWV